MPDAGWPTPVLGSATVGRVGWPSSPVRPGWAFVLFGSDRCSVSGGNVE